VVDHVWQDLGGLLEAQFPHLLIEFFLLEH
jgi:hypothetical protein